MRFLVALVFAAATAAASATDVLATLRAGHPRLLLTDAQLARNLEAAKTDPLRAELHRYIVRVAEGHFADQPIQHLLIGQRLLEESRKAIAHVLTSAMAFRLTGEKRFARFAIDQMLRAAAFPDWNPAHFLDVAEMACALALGYDWLHAQLTPAERVIIKQALLDKALVFARSACRGRSAGRRSFGHRGVAGNIASRHGRL
jgi:hypothetical protein